MIKPYKGEMKEGMKVKAVAKNGKAIFTGTIFYVIPANSVSYPHRYFATIKRDDGKVGGGVKIPNYGQGWKIRNDECYGFNEGVWHDGESFIVPLVKKITNWKELVENTNWRI